jgi:hypothetical protein
MDLNQRKTGGGASPRHLFLFSTFVQGHDEGVEKSTLLFLFKDICPCPFVKLFPDYHIHLPIQRGTSQLFQFISVICLCIGLRKEERSFAYLWCFPTITT